MKNTLSSQESETVEEILKDESSRLNKYRVKQDGK